MPTLGGAMSRTFETAGSNHQKPIDMITPTSINSTTPSAAEDICLPLHPSQEEATQEMSQ
eukprot:215231-Pelagomonas_calceolata.AAC.1